MHKTNKFFPYLLILAAIAAAMEIELSLPSFPDIARAFAVSEEVIEGTISLNFLGFCLSALFYGPLSDRFGRRPVLLGGTLLFLLGSLGCAFAPSITLILISRFVQGLGAAGSFVVIFTMLADTFQGNAATRWIGTLNAIITSVMALSPILGGYLNAWFGWNGCYLFIAGLTLVEFALLLLFLPETRPGQILNLKQIGNDYLDLLSSKRFWQGALTPTLICAGYMAFVSVIPFLYRNELGMSLNQFSWHQAAIISCFSFVSYYANRFASFFGEIRSALLGLGLTVFATVSLFIAAHFAAIPSVVITTPLMCLFAFTCAVPFAVIFSASLEVIPNKNGPASSLIMSLRTLICAAAVQLAGSLYSGTLYSSAAIVAACCVISLLLGVGFYQGEIRTALRPQKNEQI